MSNLSNCTTFLEFLNLLAEDKLIPRFTEELLQTPNPEDNYYYSMGDRWCTVEDILKKYEDVNFLLNKFSFKGLDPKSSFSSGNLKASYLPDEDFINYGSAIIIFSLVGSNWLHTVRLKNQLPLWERLGLVK
jgi:hypothetical protein